MSDGGEPMFNAELTQELFKPSTVKLSAVICDDRPRETIVAYYGFSNERLHLEFSDIGHRFDFYPFGEVVHHDKEKSSL